MGPLLPFGHGQTQKTGQGTSLSLFLSSPLFISSQVGVFLPSPFLPWLSFSLPFLLLLFLFLSLRELVMVMKKGRKVAVESSPSSASYLIGEEARAWFRHQSLLQDYEELVKETEANRKQLQKAHQKKLKLLAEVRFLRKRYKCLLKNPSQKTMYTLKKRSPKIPAQVVCHGQAPNPVTQEEVHQKDRSYIGREAAIPSTSAVLDLNQASLPNGEEMEEFQVQWEPLKVDKLNKCSTEGDLVANDLKLSICRDVGKGANRAGKRKITWQDQVALKV